MKLLIIFTCLTTLIFSNMKIYVSHTSPITTITLQEIKNLYFKKTTLLKGNKVDIYDNKKSYKQFYKMVLKKKAGAIHAYWMKQIFLGKNVPPKKIKSSNIMEILNKDNKAIVYSQEILDAKVIYVHP